MIKRTLIHLLSPICLLIGFSAALALAIWYLGPLMVIGGLRPLDDIATRLIAICALSGMTVIAVLTILLRRARRATQMTEALATDTAQGPDEEAVDTELSEIRNQMGDALRFLRKSGLGGRFGSRHLYQLPWYVVIGPPGAGKTTAIANSGLNFPLVDQMGKMTIGGVGGTRNCDWWFTDEAVLIDTAGRYTTQDSCADADARAWGGFLDLLKTHRRRQPINGAIVAISLSDLSILDDLERRAHAVAIRTRLQEVRERLGFSFPIYVIFTKADLIAGFREFFDDLGSTEREQVWGLTLPLPDRGNSAAPLSGFTGEFNALVERLSSRSLERMQTEIDHQRRSLIQDFPAQVASLRETAETFLTDVFEENRYEKSHLLRGVYFTSGTQEGTPVDRLMSSMAQTFGIGRQAIGSGRGKGRAYFLKRLLKGVIVGEAGLVSADDAVERRYRWTARGAAIAASLAVITAVSLWSYSYRGNVGLISEAQAAVTEFQSLSADISRNAISDPDLAPIVAALNTLRDLPGNPSVESSDPPMRLTFGLYQGDAVGTESAQSYRGALNTILLPRLLLRLEQQMQANINNPDLLFEALKIYLMLGLQGPMDAPLVTQWMGIDWRLTYPGQDPMIRDLQGHLTALISQPMREIALNGPLVNQVQGLLSETPLAERVYQSIVTGPAVRDLPQFRLSEIGGPAVSRVVLRPSGLPLSQGVEGIYTREGFHQVFLPEVLSVAERVQDESWVLGPQGEAETSPRALAVLARDVLNLYYTDYVARYDQLLADVDIVPMESIGHATEVLNVLSGPSSPIVAVLQAVSAETKLTQPVTNGAAGAVIEAGGEGLADFARDALTSSLDSDNQAILDVLTSAAEAGVAVGEGDAIPEPPGTFVEQRFANLHAFVDGGGGADPELAQVIGTMTEVYNELNRVSLGQNSGISIASQQGSASARLQATIGRLSGPMQRWANQVAAASSGIAVGGARAELNAKWQSQVAPFCRAALDGRYPFVQAAQADVTLQDFGKLFGPSGLIDGFFNENLLPFVDTTSVPWRWKRLNGKDLGVSDAVLAQFQTAAIIRDSFFLSGGLPSVAFDLTPVALDPNIDQVIVEVEGQSVSYAHGPPAVTPLTWPGQAGGRTRVSFTPEVADRENGVAHDGPWAWFRLLDTAEVRRTSIADRNRVVFNVGGRIAVFQLRAGSALNPFNRAVLNGFRCPRSL
ncbi:MAG: type VI secretion system membrane subunit TssM [Pseudomonadota bacterium]